MNRLTHTPFAVVILKPGRSRRVWCVVILGHVAVALAWCMVFGLGSMATHGVLAVLIAHAGYLYHWGGPGLTPNWVLQWHASGRWWLARGDEAPYAGELLPGGCCVAECVVLRLKTGRGRKLTVVLTADNIPEEVLRRLRVRLNWPARSPRPLRP